MRVSAEETPKYAKKQTDREITMPIGMERFGFRASSPAGKGTVQWSLTREAGLLLYQPPSACSQSAPKPQTEWIDYVTSGSNTVETNKCIETGGSSTENPLKAKRHESSRAHRAQARAEGMETSKVCYVNPVPIL
jgi:hypothetical protein